MIYVFSEPFSDHILVCFFLDLFVLFLDLTSSFTLCNAQVDVNGDKAAPIYKFLKSSKGGLFGSGIKWNFSKFLVDKDGNVVDRYAPTTSPLRIEVNVSHIIVCPVPLV